VLRIYGVRVRVLGARPFPQSQTVYISNHTSTLDLFVLVALGLPNCRFFLSGFVRRFVPLGVIAVAMGTFFTVPQDRPEERKRIFRRAADTLKRTGESVYLSPEGGRITTGQIGHFNKGAFHIATDLRAPIVPMYFHIPREIDPGRGYSARRGTVTVHVLPPIDTADWRIDDVLINKEHVRDTFVRVHQELQCA
jgi:1-acyl-sn-glycerol-3-phosphate acyltransferase